MSKEKPVPSNPRGKEPGDEIPFLTVRCTHCKRRFGVKLKYAGTAVKCPHCSSLQMVPLAEERESPGAVPASVERAAHRQLSSPPLAAVAPAEPERAGGEAEPESDLLPPRYLVPESIGAALDLNSQSGNQDSADGTRDAGENVYQVNTAVMRVRTGDQLVAVRPLSREARDLRKRIRIVAVWILAAIILIVLLWILADSQPDPALTP